jgi:hypothetical protein
MSDSGVPLSTSDESEADLMEEGLAELGEEERGDAADR